MDGSYVTFSDFLNSAYCWHFKTLFYEKDIFCFFVTNFRIPNCQDASLCLTNKITTTNFIRSDTEKIVSVLLNMVNLLAENTTKKSHKNGIKFFWNWTLLVRTLTTRLAIVYQWVILETKTKFPKDQIHVDLVHSEGIFPLLVSLFFNNFNQKCIVLSTFHTGL